MGDAVKGFFVSTTTRLLTSTRRSVRRPSEPNSSQVSAVSKVARAVGGVHDGHQGVGHPASILPRTGLGLHQALDDEVAALGSEAVGVVGAVPQTVLDRGLP